MKLEEIGFYTMNDYRTEQLSFDSPLWRCELILTDKCNFRCPYCRGVKKEFQGEKTYCEAKNIVDLWIKDRLKNIRFSGGEPTTWKGLIDLVSHCKKNGVERIAISTNGSADFSYYVELIDAGVNDFSISLDACCSSFGDKMSGVKGAWNKVIDNIEKISAMTYVTVGMVFSDENVVQAKESIEFADRLGVSDIRIISAAQYNKMIDAAKTIDKSLTDKYPILRYRIGNFRSGRNVRGLRKNDTNKCYLVKDDMAVIGDSHFPCIIYLREGGAPIGKVGPDMRKERFEWFNFHDCKKDKICAENCLDICIDYNNKAAGNGKRSPCDQKCDDCNSMIC